VQNFARRAGTHERKCAPEGLAGLLGPTSANLLPANFRSLPDRGLNHGAGRRALVRTGVDRFTVALETT